MNKKKAEREQALKIIEENKIERERRDKEKEAEKLHQQRLIEKAIKHSEAVERKRAEEVAAREKRIHDAMDRMADTVIKKSNAAEKEQERKMLAHALEADRKAEERDRMKKEEARNRDLEIRRVLAQQMQEKRENEMKEKEENKRYVKMVIDRDAKDKQDQQNNDQNRKMKLKEVQKF